MANRFELFNRINHLDIAEDHEESLCCKSFNFHLSLPRPGLGDTTQR
jgi:hypothetical protein